MALQKRATSGPTFDMFIGNFPATLADVADKILRDQFSCCGAIQSVEMRMGNRGDGLYVGFVRFMSEEARARAMELAARGVVVDGLKLFSSLPRNTAYKGATGKVDGERKPRQPSYDGIADSKSDDCVMPFPDPVGEGDVLVTHIESICYFWGQIASNELAEAVATMTMELSTIQMSPAVGVLAEDKLYAAQFEGDMCWYRCKLLRQVSNDKCEVVYVDYGNVEVINKFSVMELPQKYAVLGPFATRYWLMGYQVAPVPPAKLGEGMNMMETLKDTIVTCQFFPPCPLLENVIPVRAMSNAVEIGPRLFEGEYVVELPAERLRSIFATQTSVVTKPAQSSSLTKPRSTSSVGSVENVSALLPLSPHHGGQQSSQVNGKPIPLNPPPAHKKLDPPVRGNKIGSTVTCSVPSLVADVRSGAGDLSHPTQTVVQVVKDPKLISENADLRRELNRLKQENFVWQQKQKTLTELQRNHEELKKEVTNLKKNSLLLKLETLVKNVTTVSMLRAQFPTNTGTKDCMEAGCELVSDDTSRLLISNFPALAEINTIRTSYQASQAAISALKDKADVDSDSLVGLVAVRDESRLVLYKKLEDFLSASRDLPLSDKGKQIEAVLLTIRATYKDYLVAPGSSSPDDLSLTMSEYSKLKAKKSQLFEDTRTRTDQYRREAASAMNRIRKLLVSSDIEDKSLPDLEKVINLCQTAIDIELKITSEAQDPDEKARISHAVKTLVRELDRELLDINQISEAYADYAELCIGLRMWLTDKPDVDELHACMKRIKILKSKLRHLLADRVDAQEGVGSVEELKNIDINLSQLREQLQTEYATEDLLLNHTARLAMEHFPELFLQYPEFNLSSIVEYGSLIKMGRALDQFDLTRLCENNANVHKSVVCGKPVVLKEFIIGDNVGVKRDDFLRRVLVYSKVGDVDILQPQGLFMDQADRLVVVQLPYMEHNLSSFIGSEALTNEAAYRILDGVLSGLEALHLANLVHGSVHPNNVLIDASGRGVLADYDFTKIPLHRAERKFTTSNGIKFVAPEISSSAITCASDMYNLGLLILWMHHPNRKFVLGQMNIPNISAVELPNGLLNIVKALLQATPTRRPSATQLRKEKYFLVPPIGYRPDDGHSNDLSSKDIAKVSELIDDDSPSSGSEDIEESLLEKKKNVSETLRDSSVDSNFAEKTICVDVVGSDVLTELSNPSEWSDKLTDELIPSSSDNNANNEA